MINITNSEVRKVLQVEINKEYNEYALKQNLPLVNVEEIDKELKRNVLSKLIKESTKNI